MCACVWVQVPNIAKRNIKNKSETSYSISLWFRIVPTFVNGACLIFPNLLGLHHSIFIHILWKLKSWIYKKDEYSIRRIFNFLQLFCNAETPPFLFIHGSSPITSHSSFSFQETNIKDSSKQTLNPGEVSWWLSYRTILSRIWKRKQTGANIICKI